MSYISARSLKDAGSSVYVEIFTDGVDYTSGTTTQLTAANPLPSANNVWVYFDGVVQHHSEYGISGYSVIFDSAIPTDTANVEIQFSKEVSSGVPGQGAVTYSMLTSDNATSLQRKNAIINGNFDIWQRATSQTSSGYGSDDRWVNIHSGTTKTASRADFPPGSPFLPDNPRYYSRTVVTSVAGASNYCIKLQRLESVRMFAGETVTLSFWARADATKNIATEWLQKFGTGGSPSVTVEGIGVATHNLTTSWQKYTTTITVPSISGKTLGTNNDDHLQLQFWFESGTTYDARNNSLGQQSGTFDIAQVQVEKGSTATDFERRSVGDELQLCKRYCQIYTYDIWSVICFGRSDGTTAILGQEILLPVEMRAVPTLTPSGGSVELRRYDSPTPTTTTGSLGLAFTTVAPDKIAYYHACTGATIGAEYRIATLGTAITATFDAEL